MKSIVISSNGSGGGKTTVTLGIMKAIIKEAIRFRDIKLVLIILILHFINKLPVNLQEIWIYF